MSKKVALMCGHGKSVDGSWDSGCTYGGYTEAGLMLPITKAAVKYLRSYGVTVISDADTNNNKNMIVDVRWANSEDTDIYVSVHCDYSKAPSGVMPLYVSSGGKKLATALNNAVKSAMGMKSRGIIRRTDLWELNGTDMVACILETGAIKADLNLLKKNPDSYGKAIAKGICDYLGVKTTATTPSTPAPAPTTGKTLYRVRHSWNEPATQVGAYYDLNNAKKMADAKGLNVYGANGKLVYSGKKSTPTASGTYIGQAASDVDHKAGDSTGKEVLKSKFHYSSSSTSPFNWTYVFRPKDSAKAEKAASMCEKAIANNAIGYNSHGETAYGKAKAMTKLAKAVNYDLSKITTKCGLSCGDLICLCNRWAGLSTCYIGSGLQLANNYKKNSNFMCLNYKKGMALKRGDVLITAHSNGKNNHVAMVL